jgi:hypothetical protein
MAAPHCGHGGKYWQNFAAVFAFHLLVKVVK